MGQCYYVRLYVRVKDEEGAIAALKEKIALDEANHTNYNVEEFKKLGVDPDTLEGSSNFLAGWEDYTVMPANAYGYKRYISSFDACYGWERVMMEFFDVLGPYCSDTSSIKIYPDSGLDHAIVKKRDCGLGPIISGAMLEVLDIQEQLDYLIDDDGHEYEFIIVTAIYDPEEPYSEMWFGKESDQESAMETGIDCRLYAYLPDCFFEDILFGRLSSHDIRVLWDYIEKHYD